MIKSLLKSKTILFYVVLIIFLYSFISYAYTPDYLMDLDLSAFGRRYQNIKKYESDIKVIQNELKAPDIASFIDGTVIKKVLVKDDDESRLNKIAITIDDSFTDKYTEEILDVLDKHNCKATFFITYKLLVANPHRVFEIVDRGHEIANHSMTHPPFKNLHVNRKEWELSTLNDWVKTLTGINMSLCRFPTGSYDKEAVKVANKYNLYPIGWSIDTDDWRFKDLDKIYHHTIAQKVESGSIVLFHNGYVFSKDLFDKLLTYYENEGYSFIKTSDLIYKDNYVVKNGVQEPIK